MLQNLKGCLFSTWRGRQEPWCTNASKPPSAPKSRGFHSLAKTARPRKPPKLRLTNAGKTPKPRKPQRTDEYELAMGVIERRPAA